ncbi:helix-turn-helix transcriptional regulator [Nostoc ellipsosporum NOK]|nr:helix-turn-helix transcriptional regulator [Nostoc ellipsosporum NOK]
MTPYRIRSISEFHSVFNLPKPEHPLISIVDYAVLIEAKAHSSITATIADYYSISVKRGLSEKMRYGQQDYDFDEGVMYFLAPGQLLQTNPVRKPELKPSGWILLIHPDFLWNTPLAKRIRQYDFFDYAVNEALFLSEKEELTLNGIIQNIRQEYHTNIDKFSQNIIISQIETLLNYSERFYQRQFITRQINNHHLLNRLEEVLDNYFANNDLLAQGQPTVQYIASQLNISQAYLRSMLKLLTGRNTQQHIHDKLIEKAKEKLSTTTLSVSEIAYELGFEHSQSFSKFFKTKTNVSPSGFRQSFN